MSKATNSRTKSYMSAYIDRCGDCQCLSMFTMLEEDFDILNDIVEYINHSQYAPEEEPSNPFNDCGIRYDEFQPYITGNRLGKFNLNPHHFKNYIDFPKALERCLENLDNYNDKFKMNLYKYSLNRFNDNQKQKYRDTLFKNLIERMLE